MILSLKKNFFVALIAFLSLGLAGCSIGTEVGNGVKPKPAPEPQKTNDKGDEVEDTETSESQNPVAESSKEPAANQNQENTESTAGNGQEAGKTKTTSEAPLPDSLPSPLPTTDVVLRLLLNTCASPWAERDVQKPIFLATGATVPGLQQVKIAVIAGGTANQSIFEWGQPATSLYGVDLSTVNEPLRISVKNIKTGQPAFSDLPVTCGQVTKQNGQLLGAAMGSLQSTTAELVLQGKTHTLIFYLKESAPFRQLVMIRIILANESLPLDFKPF